MPPSRTLRSRLLAFGAATITALALSGVAATASTASPAAAPVTAPAATEVQYAVSEPLCGRPNDAAAMRCFGLKRTDFEPQVYYRLTASWLELTVRFAAVDRGTRSVGDRVARDVLTRFEAAGISVATAEHRIVGLPPLELRDGRAADR